MAVNIGDFQPYFHAFFSLCRPQPVSMEVLKYEKQLLDRQVRVQHLCWGRVGELWIICYVGAHFSIRMQSCWYKKFHCEIKLVVRLPYLYNRISSTDKWIFMLRLLPGPRLDIKERLSRYRDSHYIDKMVTRPSYLYDVNLYTGKVASLYWDSPLIFRFQFE